MKIFKSVLGLAVAAILVGCEEDSAITKHVDVFEVPSEQVEGGRFTVERHGKFRAGFENNIREILIIRDSETKRSYIGITGVGVTELRTVTTTTVNTDGGVDVDTETAEQ